MQIFVKSVAGTRAMAVEPTMPVAALKAAIAAEEGVTAETFSLASGMSLLEEGCVADHGVLAESTINVVFAVDGGKKKKKKKKVFKGPKKPTHRHKNVPMRVLKFYKVEGDGEGTEYKVTHAREECPHPDCGAGVFMAVHKDRKTCGKCSLTYVLQKK